MEPDVTGLPLELAKKLLASEGYVVEAVDYSVPPPNSTRHRLDASATEDYVCAAFFRNDARNVSLRVVSVPSINPDTDSE